MQICYLNSNLFVFCSNLLDEGKQRLLHCNALTLTFYSGGEEKGGEYSEKENIFFLRRRKTEKEKEENIWRRSQQKLYWFRFRNIWYREKSISFGKFWHRFRSKFWYCHSVQSVQVSKGTIKHKIIPWMFVQTFLIFMLHFS